jgi:hypothetical protein
LLRGIPLRLRHTDCFSLRNNRPAERCDQQPAASNELITQNSLYRGQEHKFVVNLAKIESIPIDKFISEIVPNVDSIEIMLENRHMDNRDGS